MPPSLHTSSCPRHVRSEGQGTLYTPVILQIIVPVARVAFCTFALNPAVSGRFVSVFFGFEVISSTAFGSPELISITAVVPVHRLARALALGPYLALPAHEADLRAQKELMQDCECQESHL